MLTLRVVAGLLLTAVVQGPPAPSRGDSSSGLVVGQVVDAESGRPITGAVVILAGPSPAGGGPHPRILTGGRVTTGATARASNSWRRSWRAEKYRGIFNVGRIGRDQLADYATRKGMPLKEAERWLGPNP